jgi:hypothetical protein
MRRRDKFAYVHYWPYCCGPRRRGHHQWWDDNRGGYSSTEEAPVYCLPNVSLSCSMSTLFNRCNWLRNSYRIHGTGNWSTGWRRPYPVHLLEVEYVFRPSLS